MVVVPSRCSVSYTFQITSSPRGHIAHSSVLAFRGSFQTRTSFDLRPDDVAISPPGASKHKPCPLKVPDSNVTTMWPHRNGARTSWCTSHSPIATGRPLLLRNLSCRVLSSMPDTPATHIVEIPVASKLYRAGWVTPHSGHSFPCGSPASEYPQAGHSFRRIARGRGNAGESRHKKNAAGRAKARATGSSVATCVPMPKPPNFDAKYCTPRPSGRLSCQPARKPSGYVPLTASYRTTNRVPPRRSTNVKRREEYQLNHAK